jgi:hypothetical protein
LWSSARDGVPPRDDAASGASVADFIRVNVNVLSQLGHWMRARPGPGGTAQRQRQLGHSTRIAIGNLDLQKWPMGR